MNVTPSPSTTAWSTRFQALLGAVRDLVLLFYGIRWLNDLMSTPGPIDWSKASIALTMACLPSAFWADRLRLQLRQPAPPPPSGVNGTGTAQDYQHAP